MNMKITINKNNIIMENRKGKEMEDFKEKANATCEEIKESVKQGAADFIDDAALLKHSLDEVADDRDAEKAARKAERKSRFDNAVAEIKESFAQGIDALKSDMSVTKSSVDEVAEDQKAVKAAKKAERREKFDNAVKELRDSIAQGGEEFRSDGAVLLGSLKEIAEDAGIDMKENEAISDAYHTVKESFEQGIENFKSDMTVTKDSIEEASSERKEEKASKKAEKKEAFLKTVESVKDSVEEGKEAFVSDMNITKESMEEIAADRDKAKAEKKAEKRERFDEKVDELKKSLE